MNLFQLMISTSDFVPFRLGQYQNRTVVFSLCLYGIAFQIGAEYLNATSPITHAATDEYKQSLPKYRH